MRIAYQGEPGAFSEAAARQVSADAELVPLPQPSRTSSTRSRPAPAGYGVLPIENSIGGSIHRNFDLLLEHHLPIVGEVELPVVHHLLALPGTARWSGCGGSIRTRRRWRSAIGFCGR